MKSGNPEQAPYLPPVSASAESSTVETRVAGFTGDKLAVNPAPRAGADEIRMDRGDVAGPDESPEATAWDGDASASGYVEPPPMVAPRSLVTAPTWRDAGALLTAGAAVSVAHRGVKEVVESSRLRRTRAVPHGLACDWEDDLCLEDNAEYVHENVRRYRTPSRGSRCKVDAFLRLGRELGDNFWWGTYLITAQGNKLWTFRLYQLPPAEVERIREKEIRHMRKCGRRVAIKPLGVSPDVLRLALEFFPVGNIQMRHALSLPEAPKTCAEILEQKSVLWECVQRSSNKLPCYHYYKDKLTLVREGIEPNPGPATPETGTAYTRLTAEYRALEAPLIARLSIRHRFNLDDRRTFADLLSTARLMRASISYDPETDELDPAIWAGHRQLLITLEQATDILYRDIETSGLIVRGTGIQFPGKPRLPNEGLDACFWTIFVDLIENDCPLAKTIFARLVGPNATVLLGQEAKSNLLGAEKVVDPRIAFQSGPKKADIQPINTDLDDQKGTFTDPHIEVPDDATRKREKRREAWSNATAVPLGLLDLCRYVLCNEHSSPYRLYGIYRGLVATYKRTGDWEINEHDILKAIEEEEKREAKIADRGLALSFHVDESLFPMYFTVADASDLELREYFGLYKGDVVVSDANHTFVRKDHVYELTAQNAVDELVLFVRNYTSGKVLEFRYPHTWCKIATKRLYGCAATVTECEKMCQALISFGDHKQADGEMANHQHLRVKAFAAALYGLAKAQPGQDLSEAEVLRRVSEFRPVAGGTYHEAYTTSSKAVADKYMELAKPCFIVGDHTVDNSFVIIHDPAETKLNPSARLAREGPEAPLPAYARPDPNSLWEQVQGQVKRLSVGKLPLRDEWRKRLEEDVWPQVSAYILGKADALDVLPPDEIYRQCEEHAKLKGFKGVELQQYLGGAALFLRGANGEENLLDEAWRTEYGCFTKSENYALSGKKPTRSIQCPDMFVRGYQHALLANAQHNLFVNVFPHLTIKHLTEEQKLRKIRETFACVERVVCTDLTAMEKNVTSYMMTFEREIFKACSPSWMREAIDVAWDELMTKPRSIAHKMFDLFVDPMRASGEDHTSAGNFVCNLMWICAWTNDAAAILNGARPCLVEGDDGQVGVDGLQLPDAEQIAGLGIRIKLEEELADSSFVSKVIKNDKPVCDALSIAQNFSVIRDPDLGTNRNDAAKQYAMAMSYYYMYGGYPIIGPYFLNYLLRHHDAVMGSQTGILSVKKAFCSKYVGWVDPAHIEAMWQDALQTQASPRPAVRTTEADLAEVSGVSVALLQQIYQCRPTEYGNSVPTGGRFTVDDDVKDVVHAAHSAAKKTPVLRIDEAPQVLVDTWGWWFNLLLGWMFVTTNVRTYRLPRVRRSTTVRGRMGRELRQNMLVPTVERRFSWKRLLLGMIILGAGATCVSGISTVARSRGPELQARFAMCRDTAMNSWQHLVDAKSDWTQRYQILKHAAADVWRDLRSDISGRAEIAQDWWRQALARRDREIADAESMSLLLDKPLVLYVAPKEQWKNFWAGVEPFRLRWKLAQVLVVIPWFILFGALCCRDHIACKAAHRIHRCFYGPLEVDPYVAAEAAIQHQDDTPDDWFAEFWQGQEG